MVFVTKKRVASKKRVVSVALGVIAGFAASSVWAGSALAGAPEAPETGAATEVMATTATLHGVLDPKATGPVEGGTYEFVYRESTTGDRGAGDIKTPEASRWVW